MRHATRILLIPAALLLGACTTFPNGPSRMSLPGSGKNFDQFRMDDFDCRQYALAQTGGKTPNEASQQNGVQGAVVGTALGAAAGAAFNGGAGAAVGAGVGLLTGAMIGTSAGQSSGYQAQQYYDNAYLQCMYAKGNKIPVYGNYASTPSAPRANTPVPLPPPGRQPPPTYGTDPYPQQ
jgi:hypothetical protein